MKVLANSQLKVILLHVQDSNVFNVNESDANSGEWNLDRVRIPISPIRMRTKSRGAKIGKNKIAITRWLITNWLSVNELLNEECFTIITTRILIASSAVATCRKHCCSLRFNSKASSTFIDIPIPDMLIPRIFKINLSTNSNFHIYRLSRHRKIPLPITYSRWFLS